MVASDCLIAAVVVWLQLVVLLQLLSYGCNWLYDCSCCRMVASDCMIAVVVLWLQVIA